MVCASRFMLLCLGWIIYQRWRRQKANQYRRWALVKRTALHAYPREEIASLSGEAWLRFLDASYNGTGFTDGPGQILAQTAYLPSNELEACNKEDISLLLKLVRKWIKKHRSDV